MPRCHWFWGNIYIAHLAGTAYNHKKVDNYSEDSEDKDYSDNCKYSGKVFTTYGTFDNHQNNY